MTSSNNKRKRSSLQCRNVISGLTNAIIEDIAATFSCDRGTALTDSVNINSHENDSLNASIAGKRYSIDVSYEVPVSSALDIDYSCSCPDDRDGACKHVCAVLLTFVDRDLQHQLKKKRRKLTTAAKLSESTSESASESASDSNSYSKSDSDSDSGSDSHSHSHFGAIKTALKSMNNDELIDIIEQSMQKYPAHIKKIVTKKMNAIAIVPVSLSDYKSRVYDAVHQFDRLRPSQQFEMAYKVDMQLEEIIGEAKKVGKRGNKSAALQILISMADSIGNENNIEGEIWKSIHGGGGVDDSIATAMIHIIENDATLTLKNNDKIYSRISKIHSRLSGYGVEDYERVLDVFETDSTDTDTDRQQIKINCTVEESEMRF